MPISISRYTSAESTEIISQGRARAIASAAAVSGGFSLGFGVPFGGAAAQTADWRSMRDPQPDSERVKPGKEQWLVVSAICTHLGCVPTEHEGEFDGWLCHCHGSQYDSSGRIRLGPAPANLPLIPYKFASDTQIVIGET